MNKKKKILILVLVLILILSLVGGTFAYWRWRTADDQQTNITFSVGSGFSCAVDGGGDITQDDVSEWLAPADCTNSKYAIQRTIVLTLTTEAENVAADFYLWFDVKNISKGLSDTTNFKYAVTSSPTSCTDGVVASGDFYMKDNDSVVNILDNRYQFRDPKTSTSTYYLYIWLDANEKSNSTMGQEFNLSLNGECSDVSQLEGDAYAVYSEDDDSLRFYRSSDPIIVGEEYNGLMVSAVYTDFETEVYDDAEPAPWHVHSQTASIISFEDAIQPISTSYWFSSFSYVYYYNLWNLNMINVENASAMFYMASNKANKVKVEGIGNWEPGNVTNMGDMFLSFASDVTIFSFEDISRWDVSSVDNMEYAFYNMGLNAENAWRLDLSNWDASMVSVYGNFKTATETRIIAPTFGS